MWPHPNRHRKTFDKIEYSFLVKKKTRTWKKLPQHDERHPWKSYNSPIILRNGERLNAFPLRSERRKRCSLLPLLFNIALKVIARAIKQEKELKDIHFGKEQVELSLFTVDIIIDVLVWPKISFRIFH